MRISACVTDMITQNTRIDKITLKVLPVITDTEIRNFNHNLVKYHSRYFLLHGISAGNDVFKLKNNLESGRYRYDIGTWDTLILHQFANYG